MAYRTPRIKLRLKPRVIKSIVESSGMDHTAIAQKLGVDKPRVDGWVSTGVIEYSKVRALAECVKMSENVFLSTIPLESEDLPDYRMMNNAPGNLAAGDRPTVRRVRYMQSVASEMMDGQGIATEPKIPPGISVADSADKTARSERIRLEVTGPPDGPIGGSSHSIYRNLRRAIEGLNILTFQYPLDTEGVRGMSLAGSDPCIILVNSKEVYQARAFTLLHEYGHILLRRGGICDEHGTARLDSVKKRVEAWCNCFAASFLMPEAGFTAEREKLAEHSCGTLEIVSELAKKFKVSRYAAAVRAADLAGASSKAAYGSALDAIAGQYSRRQNSKDGEAEEKKGGAHYLDVLVSQCGKKFVRLAISSYKKKVVTGRDLGDYLDIDLKHFDKLCKKVSVTE